MGRKAQAELQAKRSVTCVLPALKWPAPIGHVPESAHLPGLRAILGRGRLTQHPAEPYESWLSKQFGVHSLSIASLRACGDGIPLPAPGRIVCADPVSLSFAREALILRSSRDAALSAEEIASLIASLNVEFAEEGRFCAPAADRWYFEPVQSRMEARFSALTDVLGRPVALFQPEGQDSGYWTHLANEIQILLHNHPVNRQREQNGRPMVNALWFWGAGGAHQPPRYAPANVMIGDTPRLRGIAASLNVPWHSVADGALLEHRQISSQWWLDESPLEALLTGDLGAWIEALQQVDRRILFPLWQAWKRGGLTHLNLIAPSDKQLLEVKLVPAHRLAFWKRPLPQSSLSKHLGHAPVEKTS